MFMIKKPAPTTMMFLKEIVKMLLNLKQIILQDVLNLIVRKGIQTEIV